MNTIDVTLEDLYKLLQNCKISDIESGKFDKIVKLIKELKEKEN